MIVLTANEKVAETILSLIDVMATISSSTDAFHVLGVAFSFIWEKGLAAEFSENVMRINATRKDDE